MKFEHWEILQDLFSLFLRGAAIIITMALVCIMVFALIHFAPIVLGIIVFIIAAILIGATTVGNDEYY